MRYRPPNWLLAVAAFIVVVIAVVAVVPKSCSAPKEEKGSIVQEIATAAGVVLATHQIENNHVLSSHDLQPADMLAIPASSSVISVNLNDGTSGSPSGVNLYKVNSAVQGIQEEASCGFVFVDLNTGRGLAYNAAEEMYIASASKALLTFYILNSGRTLDSSTKQDFEDALMLSDNDAFENLAVRYIDSDYQYFLESYGINPADFYNNYYPEMGARNLAAIWLGILQYLSADSEEAKWYSSLLSQTETSFIRDALNDIGGVLVLNKGGWIGEEGFESVTDAGIIDDGKHTYIMAIVTSQPDGGDAESFVTDLARALYDLRNEM